MRTAAPRRKAKAAQPGQDERCGWERPPQPIPDKGSVRAVPVPRDKLIWCAEHTGRMAEGGDAGDRKFPVGPLAKAKRPPRRQGGRAPQLVKKCSRRGSLFCVRAAGRRSPFDYANLLKRGRPCPFLATNPVECAKLWIQNAGWKQARGQSAPTRAAYQYSDILCEICEKFLTAPGRIEERPAGNSRPGSRA